MNIINVGCNSYHCKLGNYAAVWFLVGRAQLTIYIPFYRALPTSHFTWR